MTENVINTASGVGSNSFATAAAPGSAAAFTTSAPGIAHGEKSGHLEPEFIAMPAPGQVCPYSGLQRGMLYTLLREGLIQSVSLRRPGTIRGRRLIILASLRQYLRGLHAAQNTRKEVTE